MTYTPSANGTTHNIGASYSPSGTSAGVHAASTASPFGLTVNKRHTITTLTCSPLPAQINTTVTCIATVIDDDAAGTKLNPTGQVTFMKDTLAGGSCMLTPVPATTDRSSCSVTYTSTTPQVFVIIATYQGSPQHSGSTSDRVLIVFYDPSGGFLTGGG